MVLIHEAGHYTAAKILGFTVDEFAIGFGPKIFSRLRKNGERFSLRAFPLGGFCAFYGETDDDEKDKKKEEKSDVNADTQAVENQETQTPENDEAVDATSKEKGEDLLSYVMRTKEQEQIKAQEEIKLQAASSAAAAVIAEPRLGKDGKLAIPYHAQKPWKRIIVLLGGVAFNFLSAIIFSLIYIWAVGFPVPEIGEVYTYVDPETQIVIAYNDFKVGDKIIAVDGQEISIMTSYNDIMAEIGKKETVKYTVERKGKKATVVASRKEIVPPAYNGFKVGDKIISVEGQEVSIEHSYNDIMNDIVIDIVNDRNNKTPVIFEVERGGEIVKLEVERKDIMTNGNVPYDGVGFVQRTTFIGNNAGNAFTYCVPYTFKLSWSILGSFGDMIIGKQSITNMSGPIHSVKLMADVSRADGRNILILLPLLASNLAIFNLLPFPALDGAHVVFTLLEWIRKKPIKRKVEGMIHFVGMMVLLAFVFVIDILSFVL